MPRVTRQSVRQRSQPPWRSGVQFALDHASALALLGGAIAYLVGYLLVLDLADALGVAPSVFGLEFRDFVLLSLSNFLLLLLAGIVLLGTYAFRDRVSIYLLLPLDLLAIGGFLWVVVIQPFKPTVNFAIAAIALGYVTGSYLQQATWAASGATASQDPRFRELFGFARWMFLIFGAALLAAAVVVLLRGLPSMAVKEAAASLLAGRPALTGTSLDIVIRPTLARVQQPDGSDVLSSTDIPPGNEVVLVTDRGGTATLVHEEKVYVIRSADLTFVTEP